MKLQGRNLSSNMTGYDVARLQEDLQALGFRILSVELQKRRFGRATGEAVRTFQNRHHLPVTGTVDERTVTLINREIEALESRPFIVQGKVDDRDHRPAGIVVRAYDTDLRAKQLLGEAGVDANGRYRIEYSAEQFARAEKINADLIVRAYDDKERPIAGSEILFNAPPEATIDLTVERPTEKKRSEFERLLTELQPLLDGVPLADLNSDDIAFLVGETGLEREPMFTLSRAARFARDTELPTEAFYGLARMGLKLDLESLLREKLGLIHKTLLTAINKAIIPAAIEDRVDEILERWRQLPFEQGLDVAHELFVELRDLTTESPLADFGVSALDLDADEPARDLGSTVADGRGRFAINYTSPRLEVPDDGVAPVVEKRLQFVVTPPGGAPLEPVPVTIRVGNREIIPVLVAIPALVDDTPTITDLKDTLALPQALVDHLVANGIESLEAVRAHGGIDGVADLPVARDDPAVKALAAHANLNLLSDDVGFNQRLIERGLPSTTAIARRSRADFVTTVGKLSDSPDRPVGDLAAARLHAQARGGALFLNNVVQGLAADAANGIDSPVVKALPALAQRFASRCACDDCESAVSPLAYLTDLLDYVTTHMTIAPNGAVQLLSLQGLDDQIHQSFGNFSVDCALVENSLPQVRLCIEVLRGFAGTDPFTEVAGAAEYRLAAYRALLAALGTSYQEIRAARGDDEDARQRLAARIGIDEEDLDDLPVDLDTLTEARLEQLFGLTDTTREALSHGSKIEDTDDQLQHWDLRGAEWRRNTDEQGLVHLSLRREDSGQPGPSGDRFIVEVFRDPGLAELIASGERSTPSGPVTLTPENGSRLRGELDIDFSQDTTLALSQVPLLLSHRYARLRSLWHAEDHLDGATVATRDPIVDPDLIGPADLRTPDTTDPVFTIWQARRQQLQDFLTEIQDRRQASLQATSLQATSLEETILARLGRDVAALELLQSQLEQGTDMAGDALQSLGLEPAGLIRLLALVDLSQGSELLDQELDEFDGILLQARKLTLFGEWRGEESDSNIILGPAHFRLASEPPETLPLWRATRRQRRDWQRRLKGRIEQQQALHDEMHEAVGKAEQAALPMLRDALILASNAAGDGLEAKADWVTRNLLIDARADICLRTTRAAQAIETVQGLVTAVRRGAVPEGLSTLIMDADGFDQQWQWLGSYQTWRAAMLLSLFPENLLLPSLRGEQTPGFKQLLETVRGQRRLTPEQACYAAHRYAQYFKDICSLRVETSCRARALIHKNEHCRGRVPVAYKDLDYFFGRGTETRKVYWSSTDPRGECGQGQSYWAAVPNLEHVEAVIGAVPYRVTLSESYICLFVQVREDDRLQLKLSRYRLEQQRWDEESVPLDLPARNGEQPTEFSAVACQRGGVARPHLAVFAWSTIYDRRINRDANGWDDNPGRDAAELHDDWSILAPSTKGRHFQRVWSMVDLDANNCYLLAQLRNGQLQYRLIGPMDDGHWHPQFLGRKTPRIKKWIGDPVGAFRLGGDALFAFWRGKNEEGNPTPTFYRKIEVGLPARTPMENIMDFEGWLRNVTGLSLSRIAGAIKETEFSSLLDFLTQEIDTGVEGNDLRLMFRIREAAETIGNRIQEGELGIDWLWADFMVKRMSNKLSLGDVLFSLVEKRVFNKNHSVQFTRRVDTLSKPQQAPSGLTRVAPAFTPAVNSSNTAIGLQFGDIGAFQTTFISSQGVLRQGPRRTRLTPVCCGPFDITEQLSDADRAVRRGLIEKTFNANENGPESNQAYLEEAFYFVPMFLALQLRRRAQYEASLRWFRTVYDYTLPVATRKIYRGLVTEETLSENYRRARNWLKDPLDPHAIAATRANSYTRFTQQSIIQCLLEFGDAEFSRDTAESVPRARTLYQTALELLDSAGLGRGSVACQAGIDALDAEVSAAIAEHDPIWQPAWNETRRALGRIADQAVFTDTIDAVRAAIASADEFTQRITTVLRIVANAFAGSPKRAERAEFVVEREQRTAAVHASALSNRVIVGGVELVGQCASEGLEGAIATATGIPAAKLTTADLAFLREPAVFATPSAVTRFEIPGFGEAGANTTGFELPTPPNPLGTSPTKCLAETYRGTPLAALQLGGAGTPGYTPAPSLDFCVPRNPIPPALRLHAQLNLFKIRTCRNIAGDQRALEPYAAPVDVSTGLPRIGTSGEIVIAGRLHLPPTPYRYTVLLDRAKQLVALAQQVEAAFLSALEKHDAEFYNLIRARQEVRLARAGVRLQDLRVKEAGDGVSLAELQRERAEIQEEHFADLLVDSTSALEYLALASMGLAAVLHTTAANMQVSGTVLETVKTIFSLGFAGNPAESAASAFSFAASAASTTASIFQTQASYERREQEWQFQKNLGEQDIRIGSQQIKLAKDRVRIVGQERTIADIQTEHANESMEFLANKFTNAELYEYISEVLEGIYGYFLQQATSMARLAERQLAFERQEIPPPMIQSDYWEAPLGLVASADIGGETTDRRGITGSVRLLQDITRLDQFAFQTDVRKLQLTKTLSVARLAPAEFQRFRESGVMLFKAPLALFDQDFPGHYLRLIKRVRLSLIALIPPIDGIKATLGTTGISHVWIDAGGSFQKITVTRPPESVALTSPRDATGLFELLPQTPEKLFPFEGLGVDTPWEIQLPKAANFFDYSTIADLLITIEYTALNSLDYRRQVIKELDSTVSADRPFSFRNEFADQWYELNNPEQADTPMVISITTRREDFPPNLTDLKIDHLVLFFSLADGAGFEVPVSNLRFEPEGSGSAIDGGGASTIQGVISTRRANGAGWTGIANQAANPFGTWTLSLSDPLIPFDPSTPEMPADAFKNEEIEDILLVITYSGLTSEWPA